MNGLNGRLCHLIHLNEPLGFYHGFDGSTAAIMCTYIMRMRFNTNQQPQFLQLCNDSFSCLITIHAFVFGTYTVHGSIIVHYVDFRQIVTTSNFKVVGVMSRCDLNRTCTKFFIYIAVGNDGNFLIHNGQDQSFTYQMSISFIIGMNSYCGITQHSLRTGGGDFNKFIAVLNGIFDMPEMSVLLFVNNFRIRNRSFADRTPVDNSGSLVNVSFLIKPYKYFFNSFGTAFIHGKTFL